MVSEVAYHGYQRREGVGRIFVYQNFDKVYCQRINKIVISWLVGGDEDTE